MFIKKNEKVHCFIIGGDLSSAANYRSYNLSIALKEQGLSILVICENKRANLTFIENLKNKGIILRTYKANKIFLSILKTRMILWKFSPVFVYQTNPTIRAFLSLFLTTYKLVGEWDEPELLKSQGRFKNLLSKFLHYWFLRKSKIKISCTKYYQKFIPGSFYIPHGQYINEKFDLIDITNEKEKYFVYLGNFYKLWDHDLLFKGLLKAKKNNFSPLVKFIGNGPEYKKWVDYAKKNKLNNIQFEGFLNHNDLMKILNSAHALLFPMRDTPLNKSRCPSKIFAYIASKRPIIAHGVGEIKSLLGGKAKLYSSRVDLIEIIRDLPDKLDNVDYDNKKFSYEIIAQKYIKLINEFYKY